MSSYRPRHKDLAALARKYRKQGWQVEPTKGGHIKWTAPDGRWTITGSTPGRDGMTNTIRRLNLMAEGKDFPGLGKPGQGSK